MEVAFDKRWSTKQVDDLRRTELLQMSFLKHHVGRYLLLRIISRPGKVSNVAFFASVFFPATLTTRSSADGARTSFLACRQDPAGNACLVGLYNSPWYEIPHGTDLDGVLPLGTVFAIK